MSPATGISKLAALTGALLLLQGFFEPAQIQPGNEPIKTPACGPRVLVEYTDDDPDYFIIKNRSADGWSIETIAFDLTPSSGNLVFDPETGGAGVGGAAGFVPDQTTDIRLVGTVPAKDGGRTLSLRFQNFTHQRDYTFHIDLDASPAGQGRTWVLPEDMAGTRILVELRGPRGQSDRIDAAFDANAEADTGAGGCV
ncbi:MAG: hypothetical protein MPJ78_15685 [Hyphomicrobiaceae bacterium]|nr:hypothetical protein [Hyphomicrobiaceae bacterium]